MKTLGKHIFLFVVGGTIYLGIELIFRGYSHYSMFFLGGLCFVCMGLINEVLSWGTPLWKQSIIGGAITTLLEFITGCIVNLWLGWNIWHYNRFDILGQVCIPFFFVWCGLSIVGIILDDWLRYWIFKEEKPHYKL
jgi:uncharacterized membrane protein